MTKPKKSYNYAAETFFLFILLIISIIIVFLQGTELQSKYSNAMNFAADVWCQDQTYSYDIDCSPLLCRDKIHQDGIECRLPESCHFEIRHYTTGRFIESEQKIECLGEPKVVRPIVYIGGHAIGELIEKNPNYIYQKSQKFDVPM